ncbi:MAG TPA: 4-hydroxybenzoyl-CoA thioesterase [Elusimicrobia bacterium]|nr:4-hydroxybenzoyl-CoA thioesterase [Elusimicrobiota bacterium]
MSAEKIIPAVQPASINDLSAEIEAQVPFCDLDPLGVVWHGNYYKYFELARTELMRSIGFDIEEMRNCGYVWPVAESSCRYISPLRYGMRVVCRAVIMETEHRLKIAYRITEKESGRLLAKGQTMQVAVKPGTWELCLASPEPLLNRVKAALKKRKQWTEPA